MNVFFDFKFQCSAKVTGWNFYVKKPGKFYACVWRIVSKEGDKHTIKLIGKNAITVDSTGVKNFDVPETEQISAKKGDIIGTMYDAATGKGVVPYEQSNKARVTSTALSAFWNEKTKANVFPVGVEKTVGLRSFQRSVAMNPKIDACCTDFQPDIPLRSLNFDSGQWMNLFFDLKFHCEATVTGWKFYAKKTGKFYACVWRLVSEEGADKFKVKLIAKNPITVTSTGLKTVSVTSGQAKVKPGDFIGTMYDAATGKGVVPYEQSNKPRVTTGELGRFWNQKTKATKVPVGFEATFGLRTFQRTVALEPVLSEE